MALDAQTLWETAFPDTERPQLYLSNNVDDDGFQPLSDPQKFISDIKGFNHLQLYAASVNGQLALKQAQDEFLDIARDIAAIKGKDATKNPQTLQDSDYFEERKESTLYSYRYEAPKPILFQSGLPGLRNADELSEREKIDVCYNPEPFQQGGFVPTEKQYKAMVAKNKQTYNVDGWKPVERNGKLLIPVQQSHADEYTLNYVRRKLDENGEVIHPDSDDTDNSTATPSKVINRRLINTRFGGKKHPPTREVSEAPSATSTPSRKRRGTPAVDERELAPSIKRQKPNDEVKPKHHNQYTKAKELAAQAALRAGAGGARDPTKPNPIWAQLSAREKRERKWSDLDLLEAIKEDHTWLHDDPNKSADWKDKIINGTNPVRSYSMLMKWAYWKVENKDKRPRGKKNANDRDKDTMSRGSETPTPRDLPNSARESASASPYPESAFYGDEMKGSELGSRPMRRGRSGLGVQSMINYDDDEKQHQSEPGTTMHEDLNETVTNRSAIREQNYIPLEHTIILKKEDTGSEITVNGEFDREEDLNGRRSQTGTPLSKKASPAVITPTRRSLRYTQRGSS